LPVPAISRAHRLPCGAVAQAVLAREDDDAGQVALQVPFERSPSDRRGSTLRRALPSTSPSLLSEATPGALI
jgi:hypothetical protein